MDDNERLFHLICAEVYLYGGEMQFLKEDVERYVEALQENGGPFDIRMVPGEDGGVILKLERTPAPDNIIRLSDIDPVRWPPRKEGLPA